MKRLLPLLACLLMTSPALGQAPAMHQMNGFELPKGFEVSLWADDSLATDIHCMTVDARGRVVVAGKGYVKALEDTDGDGKADKATLISDWPKSGAHGLCFDGEDLICVGDAGVHRMSQGKAAGKPWLHTKMAGDHVANGIIRGPDGWFYLACGNDAGVGADQIRSPGSPVKKPHMGVVVRFSPDGSKSEVVADGFRNPYDLAFNALGDLFTVDADGERIHYLPYYTPTRLFDIAQGRHHGWVMPGWVRSWARPGYWPDNVDRLVEIGRGSPTGVHVYRHRAFPSRYRDGVFSLCWTFGCVYFFPTQQEGASYTGSKEIFMKSIGDAGFAPTDMAVGPEGELFVSIGGRSTRGSVFRIRYVGSQPLPTPTDSLRAVLTADEPLSSWSRTQWVPEAKKLGRGTFLLAAADAKLPLAERIRAIEILTELYQGLTPAELAKLREAPAEVLARATWSLSRSHVDDGARLKLAELSGDPHPRVARAAWEAIGAWPTAWQVPAAWAVGLDSSDTRVRFAAIQAARAQARESFAVHARASTLRQRLAALWIAEPTPADVGEKFVATCVEALNAKQPATLRMEGVRLLQLALGDVRLEDTNDRTGVGYAANSAAKVHSEWKEKIVAAMVKVFPTGDESVDREIARLVAMTEEPASAFVPKVTARLGDRKSLVESDLHFLLSLARMAGPRTPEDSARTAEALNGIFPKLAAKNARPADQVPPILEALCDQLVKRDPNLPSAIVESKSFAAAGSALFANRLPLPQKQQAARLLLANVVKLDEDAAMAAWTPDLVRLVASLPVEEALPPLRVQAANPALSDPVALYLAAQRKPEDRPRLVAALDSSQPKVVSSAAEALAAMPEVKAQPKDLAAAVKALRRVADQKDAGAPKSVANLLTQWSGQTIGSDAKTAPAAAAAWLAWFTKTYPSDAPNLLGMTGADPAQWLKRLDKVDWDAGDEKRGLAMFQRKACFRCHGDARRLGPDLGGIAQRFGRNDLFLHIVDPSKDISPAYTPTQITTTTGKIYQGVLIYKSQELTLLQTSPDTTARIPGPEVQSVQPGRISFMPVGLLDDATDRDLADLYAYLRSLKKAN